MRLRREDPFTSGTARMRQCSGPKRGSVRPKRGDWTIGFSCVAAVLLALACLLPYCFAKASEVVQSETVDFPGIGVVRVEAVEPQGGLPKMMFSEASTSRKLFAADVGASDPGQLSFYVIRHDFGMMSPRMRFHTLRVAEMPSPLIFAVVMRPGGSDCLYAAALIGAVKGQLRVLTPEQLWTNVEGGFYVGSLNSKFGTGLVRWNYIWGDEAHSQPHRYEMSIFHFDATDSRFKLVQSVASEHRFDTSEEFLTTLGLHVRNLLSTFPDLGC